jgi:hypothetical protein
MTMMSNTGKDIIVMSNTALGFARSSFTTSRGDRFVNLKAIVGVLAVLASVATR